MLKTFEQIREHAAALEGKRNVLLWGADNADWLKILDKYHSDGKIEMILLGEEKAVKKSAEQAGVDISKYKLLSALTPDEGAEQIKNQLARDAVDIIVRGSVWIKDSLKALFGHNTGFRIGRAVVSGLSCHYVKDIDRMLIVTDPIVNPTPDLNLKIALVNNAVGFAHKLGDQNPKAALLAAVETVYPVMPHTIEAAAIAKMSDRGQLKGCLVDGPLSMDCAVIELAAKSKGVTGEVAGNANVLIAPNIETAYGMHKAFTRFVQAPSGAIVVGGQVPYVMASRSDSMETRENSFLLALV